MKGTLIKVSTDADKEAVASTGNSAMARKQGQEICQQAMAIISSAI
jgi:hypothetical protein